MAKPTLFPRWATNDTTEIRVVNDAPVSLDNKVEPTTEFKDSGALYRENIPRAYLNYMFNLIDEWIQHFSTGGDSVLLVVGDETSNLTVGTGKLTFRMPYAFTLTEVRASVTTAPTGSTIIVDINETGATILSTNITIDATEKTSTTAAIPPVISDTALADDSEITIDIDQIGSTIAGAGLKVTLIGTRL